MKIAQAAMSNDLTPGGSKSVLETFTEKLNLPEVIAGPAGKAISRLVAGVIDIPAAYLDAFAQTIKDKTAARTLVSNEVAEAAAKLASHDTDIVARAAHNLLAKEYRHQRNKEAVARKAVEVLHEDLGDSSKPSGSAEGPDVEEDWLNIFEKYAQDASSERLQELWARILAGEIRQPRSFSLKTLRFVSELDQTTAALFEEIAPLICLDSLFTSNHLQGKAFTDLMHLQDADLLSGVGGMISQNLTLNNLGQSTFQHQKLLVLLEGTANAQVSIPAALLTKTGVEILKILKVEANMKWGEELAKRIPKDNLKTISYAGFVRGPDGFARLVPAQILWQADPPKEPV